MRNPGFRSLPCPIDDNAAEVNGNPNETSALALSTPIEPGKSTTQKRPISIWWPRPSRDAILDAVTRYLAITLKGSVQFWTTRQSMQGSKKPIPWFISKTEGKDIEDCITLFEKVFSTSISRAMWNWKYSNSGHASLIARTLDGKLIAHYGATLRNIRLLGEDVKGLQVCDVMVDPAYRGVMTKKGAFYELARSFQESCFNNNSEYAIAFGFPNMRAMKVATILGLYAEVDRVVELRWKALQGASGENPEISLLTSREPTDDVLNRVWLNMRADLEESVAIKRDAEYINYRYLDHPDHTYELLHVRGDNQDQEGVVILRFDENRCCLLDIIARLNHIPDLIRKTRSYVGSEGFSELSTWVSASHQAHFNASDPQIAVTDISIPTNIWRLRLSMDSIANKWWICMGDAEFT